MSFCHSSDSSSLGKSGLSKESNSLQETQGEDDTPSINLVYNGKPLDIDPILTHNALSGISIKHYNCSCTKIETEPSEEAYLGEEWGEDGECRYTMVKTSVYDEPLKSAGDAAVMSLTKAEEVSGENISTSLSEYLPESTESYREKKPECARPRINFRNSFWNLHTVELAKLTWSQDYVSESVVQEFLHDHLIDHGVMCEPYHTEEDRFRILEEELEDFGMLRVLIEPKEGKSEVEQFVQEERTMELSDDDLEEEQQIVHRSKAEFCITIGKPVRPEPLTTTETQTPDLLSIFAGEDGEYDQYPEFQPITCYVDAGEGRGSDLFGTENESEETERALTRKELKKLRKQQLDEEMNRPPEPFHLCPT